MSIFFNLFLSIGFIFFFVNSLHSKPIKTIVVGSHNVKPLIFQDSSGEISGFYNDLLQEMAQQEKFKIEYRHSSWQDGLNNLKDSSIDLMTTIAYTAERDSFSDYHEEPVVTIWGQVNAKSDSGIKGIFDLSDKKIGVMKSDISGMNFRNTIKQFKIKCEIIEFSGFNEIVYAINENKIFAGVTPNTYKIPDLIADKVISTSIYFNPFSIYFAAPEGLNSELLKKIDRYLKEWKSDKNSPYYKYYTKWFGAKEYRIKEFPLWIKSLIFTGIISLIILVTIFLYQRVVVKNQKIIIDESERKFKLVFDEAYQFIGLLDIEGRLIEANKTSLGFINQTFDQVKNQYFWDTPWWRNNEEGVKVLKESFQTCLKGEAISFESTHLSPNNEKLYFHISLKPLFDKKNKIKSFLVEGRNISSIKSKDRQLKIFAMAIESSIEEIIICNKDLLIEYVNSAFINKTGYTLQDCVGENPNILASGKHPKAFYSDMWDKIKSEGKWKGTIINRTKKGDLIKEDVTIASIVDEKDNLVGYISVQRDMTEEILLREHVRESQKMEVIGNLIGGIAHDFNNVLSGIKGPISLLKNLMQSENLSVDRIQKYIKMIDESSKRASDLVAQFSEVSNHHNSEIENVNVIESLKNLKDIVESSFDKSIKLRFDLKAYEANIEGNKTQIEQVFLNLLVNASHALTIMKKEKEHWGGEIFVSVDKAVPSAHFFKVHPDVKDGVQYWEICFQDNGVGIDKNILNNIFTPFFSTKKSKVGSGLGLFMCYNIVKKHNGFINVYSEVGYGTTFKIFLPISITDDFDKELLIKIENSSSFPKDERGHLLIIDDEEFLRDIGADMASVCGLKASTAKDGIEGVKMFKDLIDSGDRPTMILLDMVMPNLNGKEALKEIRSIDENVPVILTSGFGSDSRVLEILQKGEAFFIQKPYSIESFKNTIKKVYDSMAGI